MPQEPRLTDAEVAEIKRNRPQTRASLACSGLFLTDDEERLTSDQRQARILEYFKAKWPDEPLGLR